MGHPIIDHAAAFLALLQADAQLVSYLGEVPDGAADHYALVYFYIETPDGLLAPEATDLTLNSDVVDSRAYVHCVGPTPTSAMAVSGRVRAAVLNQTPTVAGRACFPIRWREGQPPQRNEEVPGNPVHDQVDVYGWRSVPA